MKWILAPSVVTYFSLQIKVQKDLIQKRLLENKQLLYLRRSLNNIKDLEPSSSETIHEIENVISMV